ncbi:MAG: hypothetical protein AAGG11_17055 [Pseudomonadota bacterium]
MRFSLILIALVFLSHIAQGAEVAIGAVGTTDAGPDVDTLSCDADEVIVGLGVKGNDPVAGFGLICAMKNNLRVTRTGPSRFGHNPMVIEPPIIRQVCPADSLLVGFGVYAGQWVDRFVRLYCVDAQSFEPKDDFVTAIQPNGYQPLICDFSSRNHLSSLRVSTGLWMDSAEARCVEAPAPVSARGRTDAEREQRRHGNPPVRRGRGNPVNAKTLNSAGAVGTLTRTARPKDLACASFERISAFRVTHRAQQDLLDIQLQCTNRTMSSRARPGPSLSSSRSNKKDARVQRTLASCGTGPLLGVNARGTRALKRLESLACLPDKPTARSRTVRIQLGRPVEKKHRLRCPPGEEIRLLRVAATDRLTYFEPFCGPAP